MRFPGQRVAKVALLFLALWTGPLFAQASPSSQPAASLKQNARTPPSAQSNLPVVHIRIGVAEVLQEGSRLSGTMVISSADQSIAYLPGLGGQDNTLSIAVRANERGSEKKTYEVELGSPSNLLSLLGGTCSASMNGCVAAKRYILLSNDGDPTLLRNWSAAAFAGDLRRTSRAPGATTPGVVHREATSGLPSSFVELFLDDRYQGCYQILEEPAAADASAGLLEVSLRNLKAVSTARSPHLLFRRTDAADPGPEAEAVVRAHVSAVEEGLSSGRTGWTAHLDQGSAVDAFLLSEVMGQGYATSNGSGALLTLTADRSRLQVGALLDFGHSAGVDHQLHRTDPTMLGFNSPSEWNQRLFADQAFRSAAAARWNDLKSDGTLWQWINAIYEQSLPIQSGRENDARRWRGRALSSAMTSPGDVGQDDTKDLLSWLTLRIGYLDALLNGTSATRTTMLPPIGLMMKGAAVTLSARVTGGDLTGAVTFRCGADTLGQGQLDATGLATLNISNAPSTGCLIQATYGGDSTHAISAALDLDHVEPPAQPSSAPLGEVEGASASVLQPVPAVREGSTARLAATTAFSSVSLASDTAASSTTSQSATQNPFRAKSHATPSTVVSTVENLGAIPATQALSGLGWNLSPVNPWEFQAAAAAGAKHARFQCSWGDAYGGHGGGGELQSPPPGNVSQGYQMPAGCAQGIALSKQYGLKPTILAAYGPPFQQVLTLTASGSTPAGSTSIQADLSGSVNGTSLSTIAFPYDYLTAPAINGFLSPAHSYAGTLIAGVALTTSTHATISLASATQVAVPAGTKLLINRVLYPSAASNTASDPSIQAYVGFVRFLGNQCSAAGIACEIEIWNEPAWPDECWDNRSDCFDQNLKPNMNEQSFGPNWGFVSALQSLQPIPGVTYNWAGTHKSGDGSVLGPNMQQFAGTAFTQPASAMTVESFHPYGNNPEDNMWNEPCLVSLKTTWNWTACNTISTSTSNADEGEARSILAKQTNASYGIQHAITETGFAGTVGDDAHKARFNVRQFLGFMAANVQFVEFYRMYDTDATTNFSFMTYTNGTPSALPTYTALAGLMSDLAAVRNAPATPISLATLPSVASYSGTYPLDIEHMVGVRPNDSANSDFVAVWQRSYAPANPGWGSLPSPSPAPLTMNIPTGMNVAQILNLSSRATVPFTTSGQQVTFNVSDDPLEVLVVPVLPAPVLAVTPVAITYGDASAALTATVSFTGSTVPTGVLQFTIDAGAPIPASCSGNTSPVTCSAIAGTGSLATGTHVLAASIASDANYIAASGSRTLVVSKQNLSLSVLPVSIAYGTTGVSLSAKVNFSGPAAPLGSVTFSVDGGSAISATCSGGASPLTCTAAANTAGLSSGTHTVVASVASDTNYLPASASATLTITQSSATLLVTPVSMNLGAASTSLLVKVTFSGTATPTGALSFSLDGGSGFLANCSGSASPITCTATANTASLTVGTHSLAASLAGDINYGSASASSTLTVAQSSLSLVVSPGSITYGSPSATLSAKVSFGTSAVPTGTLAFSLDGGNPILASCTGSTSPLTCTATTNASALSTGNHTLAATMTGDANYSAATAASTLVVAQQTPTLSLSPNSTTFGSSSAALSAQVNFTGGTAPKGALSFTLAGSTAVAATCSGSTPPLVCTATLNTAGLSAGSYTVTIALASDSNYNGATASSTLLVSQQKPTVSISPVSAVYGTSGLLSATASYAGSPAPSGALVFTIDSTTQIPAACAGAHSPLTCTANFGTSSLGAGTHTLVANLAGDTDYAAASASSVLTVTTQSAMLTLNTVTIPYGTASGGLIAKLAFGGASAPTGLMSFAIDGGAPITASCIASSSPLTCTASSSTGALIAGNHLLTASLASDKNYNSVTASSTLVVTQQSLVLSVSPVSIPYGVASTTLVARISFNGSVVPTGSLSFSVDGGVPMAATCTGSTTTQDCTATANTATLAAGNHTLVASFAGDVNYSAATAGAAFSVSPQSLTISAVPTSVPYGTSSATLSARVTYIGSMAPRGAVVFTVDAGAPISATCTGSSSPVVCTASANTQSMPAGSHSLGATIASDVNYNTATASSTLLITQQNPTLAVGPNTISYGTASTMLSVSISSTGTMAPTGSLTFTVDNRNPVLANCTGTGSLVFCTANVSTTALGAGSHTINAALAADTNYSAASASSILTVSPQNPILSVAPITLPYGAATATLSSTVTFTGLAPPTGALTFTVDNGSPVAANCLAGGFSLVCTVAVPTTALAAGMHTVSISEAGDANYSTANALSSLTLPQGSLALIVSPVSAVYGASSAKLSAKAPFSGASPSGNISFAIDGGNPTAGACAAINSLLSCTATVPVGTLTAGNYTIIASLAADPNYGAANASATLLISQASTSLTLPSLAVPYGTGSVTLSAQMMFTGVIAPSGALTFSLDGGAAVGVNCTSGASPLLCTSSVATTKLSAGTHTLVASMAGDVNYAGTSASSSLTITQGTLSLSVSPVAIPYGTAWTTLAAKLVFNGPAVPSSAVLFSIDGGSPLQAVCSGGASPLTCTANLGSSTLVAGSHSLAVSTPGDSNYGAASGNGSFTVSSADLAVSVGRISIPYGTASASLTATVRFVGPTIPSGGLSFTLDNGPAAVAACLGSGSPVTCAAVVPTASLDVGDHVLLASIHGDSNYNGTSAASTLVVSQQNIAVTVLPVSIAYGTASASVSALVSFNGSVAPTLAFVFTLDGSTEVPANCSGTTTPINCSATLNTANLQGGSHSLSGSAMGSQNIAAASGSSTLSVSRQALSLVVAPNTVSYGTLPTVLSAKLSFSGPNVPSGSLTFTLDGATVSGACNGTASPLTCSAAAVSAIQLAVGMHTVSATIAGDADYSGATGTSTLTVLQEGTSTTLSDSAATVSSGQTLTVTASVSALGGDMPSGSITFMDGTTTLVTEALANGTAAFSTSALSPGTHHVTAVYAGSADFAPSSSSSLAVMVGSLDFTFVALGPSSQDVLRGGNASYSMRLTPLSGQYPGAVQLSVTGLPPGVTSTLTPQLLDSTAGVQTISLVVHEPQTVAATRIRPEKNSAALLCLLGLPLGALCRSRKRVAALGSRTFAALLALVFIGALSGLTGCGGTVGSQMHATQYPVTVQASAGGVQHAVQVLLSVE